MRSVARLPALVAVPLLLVLLAGAVAWLALVRTSRPTVSSPPVDASPPEARPVGADTYGKLLARDAGVEIDPATLAAHAAREAAWIEARLDRLAREIDPEATSWREVFARLRADHPPTPEAVVAAYREEVERARRFVLAHDLVTVPPGKLVVAQTPESLPEGLYPLVAYLGYRLGITVDAENLSDHCRVSIPPFAIHETYPGHHVAFLHQRSERPDPGPEIRAKAWRSFKNRVFHEGWGQYAELLMWEAGYFAGSPEREMGLLRNVLLRVERARLDVLLHTGEISPEEAAAALARDFFTPETARLEVAKHLEEPTMKASYLVGALQILALREALREQHTASGEPFDPKSFHDRLVAWPLPVPEAARLRFGVELAPELPRLSEVLALPEEPLSPVPASSAQPTRPDGGIIAPP